MEKLTRLQLFEKLYNGELKEDDKFIDEVGNVVKVEKEFGTMSLVWEDGEPLHLVKYSDDEYFTKVEDEKITVELTQKQINTIFLLANHTSDEEMENEFSLFHRYDTVSTWEIFNIFNGLAKQREDE
jgi:hypothetical protein